jgi:hypothetical protein
MTIERSEYRFEDALSVCTERCAQVGDAPCREVAGYPFNERGDCPATPSCQSIADGKAVYVEE